jgi:ATP-dependent Lon protease
MFPKTVAPILVDTPKLGKVVQSAIESEARLVAMVLRRPRADGASETEVVAPELHRVGVVAQILKAERDASTGLSRILVGALDRLEIKRVLAHEPYLTAEVSYLYEPQAEVDDEIKAYVLAVINSVKDLIQLNPLFKEELNLLVSQGHIAEPARLADYAAYLTSSSGEELQDVLETLELRPRLEKVVGLLKKELDISKLQAKIRQQIDERVTKQQRDFFLREQLKSIKKELGLEKDDKETEVQRFLERLEGRQPSAEAKERIQEELDKLRILEPSSPEFNVTRNYLDWLTSLPWGLSSQREVTLAKARVSLDEDHYGLDDVKSRILEFIAAGLLRGTFGGSIICLVGPPGVGKTSIGKSIARALGREFYRFSVGGMRDEAEIKGHRRTYIGAMPGKFLQALRVCKTNNPVIMLDEIDKIGSSYRGDPASALLEALDPEQNKEFLDHYLDVRFDLSNVLFVATANQLDTIPGPLLDRMEVIKLSGYVLEEKLEIASRFIVPRELESLKLGRERLDITRPALRELIEGYAREAGLRSLEQQVKRIARKSALALVEGKASALVIGPAQVEELLGKRRFQDDQGFKRLVPGMAVGLAWTSMGGDVLYVEASAIRSQRAGFKQTGQLGKVMIESSEIAYSYVRGLCSRMDGDVANFFDERFVHLHVPAGATPKDGPSAGITMATALYGLATGRVMRSSFAMTGELNLSGYVMPVGGIREKVIAARRAKLEHVVLPKDNEPDYLELPGHVKEGMTAHFVERFDEVVELLLGPAN